MMWYFVNVEFKLPRALARGFNMVLVTGLQPQINTPIVAKAIRLGIYPAHDLKVVAIKKKIHNIIYQDFLIR